MQKKNPPPPPVHSKPTYKPIRLSRDNDRKMIGGVCTGLGRYFGIDPLFVRIFMIFLALAGLPIILFYLILWILLPASSDTVAMQDDKSLEFTRSTNHTTIGLILLLIGFFALESRYGFFHQINVFKLWPIAFLIMGILILTKK